MCCAGITGWQQQETVHTRKCLQLWQRVLYERNQERGFDLDTSVYLCSSEAVDKLAPAVHTSPAAKTFSKSAAAPRNSSINPAFKSPTAPDQRSVPLGGPTGKGTRTETLVCCYCSTASPPAGGRPVLQY